MADELTTQETNTLAHWALFGQTGALSQRRLTASEWEIKPFQNPITSPWNVRIPRGQLTNLLNGFHPREMEDKWRVYADGPDERGHAAVHLHRSWTGAKMAEVRIEVERGEDGSSGSARITGIEWEASEREVRERDEQGAKEMVREVFEWVLRVRLPEETGGVEAK